MERNIVFKGYWGKCGESEPGRIIESIVNQRDPKNVLFVATSTIIDFEGICKRILNIDSKIKITFSEKNGYPQSIVEEFGNEGINFEEINVLSINNNKKYSIIVCLGLFSKVVLWEPRVDALKNMSFLLKEDGVLVVSVKFEYMDEFEQSIHDAGLEIVKWASEYEFISIKKRVSLGIRGRGDIRVTYYLKNKSIIK